jgi:molybdenum cofactor cytidylyltransferase
MISMVILAAGKSTRMPGRNKLLADVQGVPMIRRVVQTALGSKVDEVIVVVGWEQEKIRGAITGLNCKITVNRNFEQGQSSSVRRGLEEVNPSSRAVLILPGDVAKIDARSINIVIEKYDDGGCSIVVAGYEGRSGHPILLDKQLFPEIARIDEETFGLKAVVKKHQNEVCLVETGSRNVLKDIDTAADLAELSQLN